MSRKWERMIQKNTKTINDQRKKQGKPSLGAAAGTEGERLLGRSVFMPALLAIFAFFFSFAYAGLPTSRGLYWFTVCSYLLLALFFFLRRPYLLVGKSSLTTRKFNRDRTVEAKDIKVISVVPGYVTVTINNNRGKPTNWVFSKLIHRYNTDEMANKLAIFAAKEHIMFERKDK